MKNKSTSRQHSEVLIDRNGLWSFDNTIYPEPTLEMSVQKTVSVETKDLPEILFITSFPPRECGIATYSQDLIKAINNKFSNSFSIKVCALESGGVSAVDRFGLELCPGLVGAG